MDAEKFWSRVKRGEASECWVWTGSTNGHGYGRLNVRGKWLGAHRVAFELANGKAPEQCVLHSCDNPPCCNPAHLREGTLADNVQDMFARGRSGTLLYSDEMIALIRALHTDDGWSAERICVFCNGRPTLRYIQDVILGRIRPGVPCIEYASTNDALTGETAERAGAQASKSPEK